MNINEDKEKLCESLHIPIYVRNVISYLMSAILSLISTFLSSKNLLDNRHLYVVLLINFFQMISVFIKSDTSLENKIKTKEKEYKAEIEKVRNSLERTNPELA